jgi:DNA replication protein DnaC
MNLLKKKISSNQHNLIQLKAELEKVEHELKAHTTQTEQQSKLEAIEKKKYANFIKTYKQVMSLPDDKLYALISDTETKKIENPIEKEKLKQFYLNATQWERENIIYDFKNEKTTTYNIVSEKYKKLGDDLLNFDFLFDDQKTLDLKKRIAHLKQQILQLEETDYKIQLPKVIAQPIANESRKERKKRLDELRNSSHPKELGGAEIKKMEFNTYQLKGELGRFLGELDNNMVAFALTGDSGAGKSYFSYALSKLFLSNGKTVKYYSLEEGIGKLTKEKLSFFDIGNELKMSATGTLNDIERDADVFDVIVIDSYSKLTNDPKEFDWLRHAHPKTLFIIIFQKTTAKTIKGGASIMYDSSATIDVKKINGERVAVMMKGRYGTQGWIYSIDNNRIIKEN